MAGEEKKWIYSEPSSSIFFRRYSYFILIFIIPVFLLSLVLLLELIRANFHLTLLIIIVLYSVFCVMVRSIIFNSFHSNRLQIYSNGFINPSFEASPKELIFFNDILKANILGVRAYNKLRLARIDLYTKDSHFILTQSWHCNQNNLHAIADSLKDKIDNGLINQIEEKSLSVLHRNENWVK